MSLLTKSRIGQIIKVTGGILKGKYGMIVKDLEEGVGIILDPSDMPDIPLKFNALFVSTDRIGEVTEEEQTMIAIKFPNPKQFK